MYMCLINIGQDQILLLLFLLKSLCFFFLLALLYQVSIRDQEFFRTEISFPFFSDLLLLVPLRNFYLNIAEAMTS